MKTTAKGFKEGPPAGRPPWRSVATDGLILSALVLFFLLLKSYGLNPAVSDENIYFYSAWLMRSGYWPYRDFFFAHPPLHLVPGWLLLLVTGEFHLAAMKALPVVAAATSGVLVYLIARRAAGSAAALVACALYYFSHDLLRASSHWTGINCSVAWMAGGMLAALGGRGVLAGALLALGASTGVYVVPGAAVITAALALARPKAGLRCALALLGTWLAINAFFWIAGGGGYIDGVYRYHLLKPAEEGSSLGDELNRVLFHNFFLLAAPLYLAPVVLLRCLRAMIDDRYAGDWRSFWDPARHPALATGLWMVTMSLGYLAFLSTLSRVFDFYFLLIFPAAAVCGGLYASDLLASLRSLAFAEVRHRAFAAVVLMILPLHIGFVVYPGFERKLDYFAQSQGKPSKQYDFPHSPVAETLQWPVKKLFWNESRTVGERYTGILFYLWHESREFNEVAEMAAALRESAREGETIFGDSTTTPLVALLSGVEIVDRFADTNAMRFECGLPSEAEAVKELEAALAREEHPLAWVLVLPGRGVGSVRFKGFQRFFKERFETVKKFRVREQGTYELMRRKEPAPRPAPALPGGTRGG